MSEVNLNLIGCFLTLSETLSFTAAARKLRITQPSVSRQIRQLEESLKATLFIRDKHSVRLTREGQELRAQLAPLMEELDHAFKRSIDRSETLEGAIEFGCLPEVGQHFFTKLLIEFQQLHPGVDLHARYQLQHEILALLKAGELDFCVTAVPVISENLRSWKLIEERSVLVTRASNRIPLSKITEAPFVAYSKLDALLADYLKTHFPRAQLSQIRRLSTVNSHKAMVDLLLGTDSFAVMPYFSVRDRLKSGELKLASEKDRRNHLYLVTLESRARSRKNEAFRRFLMERCRESASLV